MGEDGLAKFDNAGDWLNLAAALACVTSAALAAGLTMGLLSLDTLKLKIKTMTGPEEERKYAKSILPLLQNHHFLLCTLLIFNAGANEALPIFLDAILPSWGAIIVSVTLVLIFGEVVPTAIFTGPKQLEIASKFTGVVRVLQLIFYPLAKPLSLALDKILGHDEDKDETYTRDEISAMVRILRSKGAGVHESSKQVNSIRNPVQMLPGTEKEVVTQIQGIRRHRSSSKVPLPSDMPGESESKRTTLADVAPVPENSDSSDDENEEEAALTVGEVNVITGVLGLAKLCIRDVLVPLDAVNMVSTDQVLNQAVTDAIVKVGHSRLPVFKGQTPTHIVGTFLVKQLVSVNPENSTPLIQMVIHKPLVVGVEQSLLDVLTIFQQGNSHIAIVSENPEDLLDCMKKDRPPPAHCAPLGIVTIEDIFEAMIQSEIYDEFDQSSQERDAGSLALRQMSMSPRWSADNEVPTKVLHGVYMDGNPATTSTAVATAAVSGKQQTVPTKLQGPGGRRDPNFQPEYRKASIKMRSGSQEQTDPDTTPVTDRPLKRSAASRRDTIPPSDAAAAAAAAISINRTDEASPTDVDEAPYQSYAPFSGSSGGASSPTSSNSSTNSNTQLSPNAATAAAAMDGSQQVKKRASMLRRMSSPIKAFFGVKKNKNSDGADDKVEALLPNDTVGDEQQPDYGSLGDYSQFGNTNTTTKMERANVSSPMQANAVSFEDMEGGTSSNNNKSGRDEKESFYKKYDAVFDSMGVPLMEEHPDNNRKSAKKGNGSSGKYDSRMKPTMVAKYGRERRYTIDETNGGDDAAPSSRSNVSSKN